MDLSTVEQFPETPVPPPVREEQWTNLLDRARSGDREASGSLLERCRSYLLRIADREVPENFRTIIPPADAVQEVFLLAYGRLKSFNGATEREFVRWMRAMTADHLRRKVGFYRRRMVGEEHEQPGQTRDQSDLDESGSKKISGKLEHHLEQEERQQAVLLALANLPDHYRLVVELRNLERKTFQEIGWLMDCDADASRKLWIRALTMIREKLREFDADSHPLSR